MCVIVIIIIISIIVELSFLKEHCSKFLLPINYLLTLFSCVNVFIIVPSISEEIKSKEDGCERIKLLQDKINEMRKVYSNLKAEVASIDRKKKRLKKKRGGSFVVVVVVVFD